MGKFKRIFHHITVEEVKAKWNDSLKESIVKQFKQDEEKRIVDKLVDEVKCDWKSELSNLWEMDWGDKLKEKQLEEGMTTQVLTGILPSAGNTDLDMLQLGATGSDLSYTSGDDSPVEGEFTALVNTDPITSVTDPLDVGTNIRSPQNGASLSLDFTDSDVFHTHSDPVSYTHLRAHET